MITKSDFRELVKKHHTVTELATKTQETPYDLQIAKEVDYLISHHNLKPKIMTLYNRESYKGEDNLRITFDENLKYRNKILLPKNSKHDKIYFKDKKNIIMEIKAGGVLPLWLTKILSENKLYPQQFSKVGKSYERMKESQNV